MLNIYITVQPNDVLHVKLKQVAVLDMLIVFDCYS
jgi:hypothetical protein